VNRPSVLIADGDQLVRDMLRRACAERDVPVVDETETLDGLCWLARARRPDVVVTADCLDGVGVEKALADVLEVGARVIVLSADPSPERLTTFLAAGAAGYLFYDSSPEEVVSGILAVARGAAALNPTVAGTILHQWRRLRTEGDRAQATLSARESDVLAAMADGLATKAIAVRLGIARKTVENHKIRIFDKLGVRTQAQAVTVAIGHGLVVPPAAEVEPNIEADALPIA
jgi:DNA-binding NarL/FixJ family response regulator